MLVVLAVLSLGWPVARAPYMFRDEFESDSQAGFLALGWFS